MDFIPENSSPDLRPSYKRISFNSRQSGDYIAQVRSLPSSNPIKQPLLDQINRNRVTSTENPSKTVYLDLLSKENHRLSLEVEDLKLKLMTDQGTNLGKEVFSKDYSQIIAKLEEMNREKEHIINENNELQEKIKEYQTRNDELEPFLVENQELQRKIQEYEEKLGDFEPNVARKDNLIKENQKELEKYHVVTKC